MNAPAKIQCAYCGGVHFDSSEVRRCWIASREPAGTITGTGRSAPFLGRSLVVSPGARVPRDWAAAPRITVSPTDPPIEQLECALLNRIPAVIELDGDLPEGPEVNQEPVWSIDPAFVFAREKLRHLVWANSLDGRREGEEPSWELSGRALKLGATAGTLADVTLADGRPAFLDGGPLTFFASEASGVPGAVVIPRITLESGSLEPFETNSCEAELASDQLCAVTHTGGGARIIAPAGSGKTRVLTQRARHLLENWKIPPRALCLVAFNKRAADEIRRRTTDLAGLQVRTLNSLALAIASGAGRFGTASSIETVDEHAVRSILQALVSFPRRANTDPAAAWIEALSCVRLGLRSPAQVEAEFGGDVDGLAEVFERYRRTLHSRNILDFDEQIYRAVEILLIDPVLRAAARAACRVMLVDEFQDLTPAHLLLIRLLAGPEGCVFGVGDDDQTIYGYAGASPQWLISYQQLFAGSGSHGLQINYRCPPAVTAAAATLLTHNRRRVEKQISSPPLREVLPDELQLSFSEEPVQATVGAVRQRVYDGIEPSSIAVLTRVNSSLAPVQLALRALEIGVNRAVDGRFLERSGVRAALAWLRLALRPERLGPADVGFTARRPARAMSPKVIGWMGEQGNIAGLRSLGNRLGERDGIKVHGYAGDLELLVGLARESCSEEFFCGLRDRVGLAASLAALDGQRRRLDRSPQGDDLEVLIDLARLHPATDGFERWLAEGLSAPGDPFGVVLATVHAVKGREWDHVIVHHASAGLMPHRLAEDLEEERRVFHVAITRARRSATVVAGKEPSPFIAQMTGAWDPAAQPPARSASIVAPDRRPVTAMDLGTQTASRMLRQWRTEKARSEARPAFTVMHDATLEAIAGSGARSLADLALIKGMGPVKLESYGDEILAILDAAYIWGG